MAAEQRDGSISQSWGSYPAPPYSTHHSSSSLASPSLTPPHPCGSRNNAETSQAGPQRGEWSSGETAGSRKQAVRDSGGGGRSSCSLTVPYEPTQARLSD
ncbi:hypothetical protein Q8A73_016745 [Channa argus]|nr:hypothetical protein Q8A73_016745 [Channa argus]